jgi:hypothetical protein
MSGQSDRKEERRTAVRFVTRNALLTYRKKGLGGLFGGGSNRPLPIRNISSRGVCFLCDEKVRKGQKLALTMVLKPGAPKVEVDYQAAWSGEGKGIYPFATGGRFVNIPGEIRSLFAHIEKHVELRRKGESETQILKKLPQ